MHGVTKLAYIIPRFTILSDKQKCKIEDKVRAIRSPYDLFVLIVKTSNVIGKSSSMVSHHCSVQCKKIKNIIHLQEIWSPWIASTCSFDYTIMEPHIFCMQPGILFRVCKKVPPR